jgi:hypothetical protein
MNCFAHPDMAAVGVCGACGRGLCRECAAEVNHKLACRGPCEERVKHLLQVEDLSIVTLKKSQRMMNANRQVLFGTAGFLAFTGLPFIALGHARWETLWFVGLLGYGFLAFAVLVTIAARRMPVGQDEHTA